MPEVIPFLEMLMKPKWQANHINFEYQNRLGMDALTTTAVGIMRAI